MDVHVYDKGEIGNIDKGTATARVKLSPGTVVTLQSLGFNVHSDAFSDCALFSCEFRGMNSASGQPQVAPLPAGELFTTYGHLTHFLMHELARMAPGRIHYHPHHELTSEEQVDVRSKRITFVSKDRGPVTRAYDLLVGADGPMSAVRVALVRNAGRGVRSAITWVAPKRFVSVKGLAADASWPDAKCAVLAAPPLEALLHLPRMETSARTVTLASPVEVLGHPPLRWGGTQFFKIRLTLFQDPADASQFIGTLDGTPELFTELLEVLEQAGLEGLTQTMRGLFCDRLPEPWVAALAAAVSQSPYGHSAGASVTLDRFAAPEGAPAVAVVGDAAHAMSPRMGYSLQAAVESAAALGGAMVGAANLAAALNHYNASQAGEMRALAEIDKLSPAFYGEEAKMGMLKAIVQAAIVVRLGLWRLLTALHLPRLAPQPSYIRALETGMKATDVYKRLVRDVTIVSLFILGAIFSVLQFAWTVYQYSGYSL